MKRLLGSTVVFAVSLGLASCSGDPTSDLRTPDRITSDPSVVFVIQDSTEAVNVQVVDEAGDPFDISDIEVTATGQGIAVARNPNFNATTVGQPLPTTAQFLVTGQAPVSTTFTLSAQGVTQDIAVKVLPTRVDLAFSNAAPAANERVDVTAAGFKFLPGAFVSFGVDTALTVGISPDSSTLTILPPPGATGPATVDTIAIGFLPATPLTLPSATEITVGAAGPTQATDDPSTAPTLDFPAEGEVTAFWDAPNYGVTADACVTACPDRFYKLVVPADADVTISLKWNNASDVDLLVCPEPFDFATCGGSFTTANPEVSTATLTAGTYFIDASLFEGEPPSLVGLTITAQPPAPPPE